MRGGVEGRSRLGLSVKIKKGEMPLRVPPIASYPPRSFPVMKKVRRRSFLGQVMVGLAAAGAVSPRGRAAETPAAEQPYGNPSVPRSQGKPPQFKTKLRITKLETFLVKPRWLFLKVHTDAGIIGLGEPIVEGRAKFQPVQKGPEAQGQVEILQGLSGGEQLISSSSGEIRDGDRVRVEGEKP